MEIIEVESIQDVSVEISDAHTRCWEDLEVVKHNFPTVDNDDDYILITHKDEKIAKIVSGKG